MSKTPILLGGAIAVVFIVLIGFFFFGLSHDPRQLDSVREGTTIGQDSDQGAISFSLPALLEDRMINDSDLPEGYFLLNVWGSWCPACHQEHPYLMELGQTIPIVGLNWPADNPNEDADAKRFLRDKGNPYSLIAVDEAGSLIIDLGVYGAPETFLIAPDKTILYRHAGPMSPGVWQSKFAPLIKTQEDS
ncbi:DsbE family thiol:disulfide interchange protein [Suttonella sp. R2A3]|uniref:DsbE family thiol:disulfide interchange protein n=1 Tax=Suttonella sp. R2A3 TaxID=2908648 RepID=UPI001F1BFC44|nr:DsbE family thiol:disulfide interchange protein [Suttonella sp. R2A3]UJF24737.1 DsbE family thiol:disulfide interchange protein [Suttonella sp. R2A3]